MANSKLWNQLKVRLLALESQLPSTSGVGSYSPQEQDTARGYTILAHAELEFYLEEACKAIVMSSVREWKSSQAISPVLFALMLSYFWNWGEPSKDLSRCFVSPKFFLHLWLSGISKAPVASIFGGLSRPSGARKKLVVGKMIDGIHEAYLNCVEKNHGVKQDNLCNLLVPLGIDPTGLDPVWLTNMDQFGEMRGESVHKGVSFRVARAIDPPTELSRVKALLPELEKLDKDFCFLGLESD